MLWFSRSFRSATLIWVAGLVSVCAGQQAAPGDLAVTTATLPKAYAREQYHAQVKASGGIPPLSWSLTKGSLPTGIELSADGVLSGVPTQLGEYPFVVTVTDSATPPHQNTQAFVLRVAAALLAKWSRPPTVAGSNMSGAIKLSNATDHDFDLTLVVLAVNEIGRATALGYQHFTLKRDTLEFEVPFSLDMPVGSYEVHADVVAEIPEIYTIYRVHLAADHKLDIAPVP